MLLGRLILWTLMALALAFSGALALLLVIPGEWLLRGWMSRHCVYNCPHCRDAFQLKISDQFKAFMGDEHEVRCPNCGLRSRVKTLRKTG
jgi:hypothetical protein